MGIGLHRDHDIPLFLLGVNIPVGLGDLFERIASIDDWLDLSVLNQLCEEMDVFSGFARCSGGPVDDFLAASSLYPSSSQLTRRAGVIEQIGATLRE